MTRLHTARFPETSLADGEDPDLVRCVDDATTRSLGTGPGAWDEILLASQSAR